MKKLFTAALSLCTAFAVCPFYAVSAEGDTSAVSVRILFTEDLHDHLEASRTAAEDGTVQWLGGYAYLKSALDQNRTETTVVVDAGDFSTGTIYNSLYKTDAPALSLMSQMGYDAIGLGEEDFQYGASALAQMISLPESVPALLSSNMSALNADLLSAWGERGNSSIIVEKNNVKIGIFSVMSSSNDGISEEDVTWTDPIEAAQQSVSDLQSQGAELIICLSHCCSDTDSTADQKLAEEVDGINVIVSGHTRNAMAEYETIGNTVIVASGMDGDNFGILDMDLSTGEVQNYQIVTVNADYYADETIQEGISAYAWKVNNEFLAGTGYTTGKVLSRTSFSFKDPNADDAVFGESNTADLITDAYIDLYKEQLAVRQQEEAAAAVAAEAEAEEDDSEEIADESEAEGDTEDSTDEEESVSTFSKQGILNLLEDAKESWIEILNNLNNRGTASETVEEKTILNKPIAIVGKSEMKDTWYEGSITAADVYDVLSGGTEGENGVETPLITAYMTGNDLRTLCELDLAVGRSNPEAQLYFGNLEYEYNDKRINFNKVTNVSYKATTDYYIPVDSDSYYPVIMSLDLAEKINHLLALNGEDLSVSFCDSKGNPADNLRSLVMTEDGTEVSQWKTVAEYIDSFGREGSVGSVDSSYQTAHAEKKDCSSIALKDMLKNTSKTGWKYYRDIFLKILGIVIVLKFINSVFRRTSLKKGNE